MKYSCFLAVLALLWKSAFTQNHKPNLQKWFSTGITYGLQKVLIDDWEKRADAYHYPAFLSTYGLNTLYKPANKKIYFDLMINYCPYSKKGIKYAVQAHEGTYPIDIVFKKNHSVHFLNLSASYNAINTIGKRTYLNAGFGINYFYTKLKFYYYNVSPDEMSPTFTGGVPETRINAHGGNLGIHGIAGFNYCINTTLTASTEIYLVYNRNKKLDTDYHPYDPYALFNAPENRVVEYSPLAFNITLRYSLIKSDK